MLKQVQHDTVGYPHVIPNSFRDPAPYRKRTVIPRSPATKESQPVECAPVTQFRPPLNT